MRLIDADALLEKISQYAEYSHGVILGNMFLREVVDEIEEAPTVDAIVIPCKPGTTVYEVSNNTNACLHCRYYGGGFGESYCEHTEFRTDYPTTQDDPVCEKHFLEVITYTATEWLLEHSLKKFGKTIFLTREEAEAALAERKMNNGC